MMHSEYANWICVCLCECVCWPQHTNDRLIKQLIKAREIGSEMRLRLFGKNCSPHHKKEGVRRAGRAETGKKTGDTVFGATGQECVKVCPMAPPPPFLHPHSPFLLLYYVCVRVCERERHRSVFFPCLTIIKNLRKLLKVLSRNSPRRPQVEGRIAKSEICYCEWWLSIAVK